MKSKPLSQLTDADELKQSPLERAFVTHWRQFGGDCPDPVTEHRFHDVRKFRFDFAWPSVLVAVEMHGIVDHGSAKGINRDCEKNNLATLGKWSVFEVTTRMLEQDPIGVIEMIADFVRGRIDDRAALEQSRRTMRQYARGVTNRDLMLANAAVDRAACAMKRNT